MMHDAYKRASRVSVYVNMDSEVDTTILIKDILQSGKVCFIPHYEGELMQMVRLPNWSDYVALSKNKDGIKQSSSTSINMNQSSDSTGGLDLIILPGLGFTENGGRLGRGKGHYDTFIKRQVKRPYLMGIAFSQQILPSVPMMKHDEFLDEVISE